MIIERIVYDDKPGIRITDDRGTTIVLHLEEAQHLRNRLNALIGQIYNPQDPDFQEPILMGRDHIGMM